MLFSLAKRPIGGDPAFADDDSMIRPVADVPSTVARLAQSFTRSNGERARIETHWLYTGSSHEVLDRAWFGRTIGVDTSDDGLDRIVRSFDHLSTTLAVQLPERQIGVQLVFQPILEDADIAAMECTFIPKSPKLILDRPLARYLVKTYRDELVTSLGKLDDVTDGQLAAFALENKKVERLRYIEPGSCRSSEIAFLPSSINANLFSTSGSYHPTRTFYEQPLRENRFENGDLIADGHIHRALTAQRNRGDPWLAKLAERYGGPARAASVLSLADSEQFMQIEHWGQRFDRMDLQYAARELFVIDDNAEIVAHSVFPMHRVLADDDLFGRFVDILKRCSVSPGNAELRLRYHDMMMELTVQLPIDQPLRRADYSS